MVQGFRLEFEAHDLCIRVAFLPPLDKRHRPVVSLQVDGPPPLWWQVMRLRVLGPLLIVLWDVSR